MARHCRCHAHHCSLTPACTRARHCLSAAAHHPLAPGIHSLLEHINTCLHSALSCLVEVGRQESGVGSESHLQSLQPPPRQQHQAPPHVTRGAPLRPGSALWVLGSGQHHSGQRACLAPRTEQVGQRAALGGRQLLGRADDKGPLLPGVGAQQLQEAQEAGQGVPCKAKM